MLSLYAVLGCPAARLCSKKSSCGTVIDLHNYAFTQSYDSGTFTKKKPRLHFGESFTLSRGEFQTVKLTTYFKDLKGAYFFPLL